MAGSRGGWHLQGGVVGERCEALNDNTEVTFELEDGRRVPAKILRSLWGTEGSFYLEGNGAQVLSGEDG